MKLRPYEQLPLDALPDAPRLPHPYAQAAGHDAELPSFRFGRHQIHWKTYGSGPPLLLVHGLMTHSYSWRYALPVFGARYTCYVPDLVGAGRTAAPLCRDYHPDAVAAWIGEFVDFVGITGCLAVGNSMGGYLCMRLALQRPDALSALVNLHAPGLPTARMWALRVAMGLPGALGILRFLIHRDVERWVHRNVHYYDESLKSREETREYALPLRSALGPKALGRYLQQTLDPAAMGPFADALLQSGFPIPLQLVYAEEDPMVPPAVGARYAALLPEAELRWLPEASHFAHVDAIDRFGPLALEFLQRHARG